MIDIDDYRDLQEKCERLEKKAAEYKLRYENLLKEVEERTKIHDEVHARKNKEADWLAETLVGQKICPTVKIYKCRYQEDKDYPLSECVKCWREAARKAVEEQCKSN